MRNILGARIRERRRAQGMTQAELARRLEISASYLNLIEHNKRGIAGPLLRRAAEALGLELSQLDGASDRRLLEQLSEIAHIPDMASLGVEEGHAGELIGRFPGWARAIASLARSERDATRTARTLADRLSHDPFLGDAVHRMLTQVASVRSAAEILVDGADMNAEQRQRFVAIIHEESKRLSEVGEALAAYFDNANSAERVLTPLGEMESLFDSRDNHFQEIESRAGGFGDRLLEATASARLDQAHVLAEEQMSATIDRIIDRQPEIETEIARAQTRQALLDYAAGAMLAPLEEFAAQAKMLGYDVEGLSDHFHIPIETVCHRLSALAPGDDIPRFGYFRANAAGTIIETRSLPGLQSPRFASACPLWVLYRAQQTPYGVLRQRTLFPNGARFVFVARARQIGGASGFGKPRHYVTDMIALSERDAALTVYAVDNTVPVEAVGVACRSCPRRDCVHRVVDPLAG